MAKRAKKKTRKQKIAEDKPTFGRTPKKLIKALNDIKVEELGK